MDTFETIKKFLAEGGKCLLIEDGKPVGVVLTMEEYELLRSKYQISNLKFQKEEKINSKINASKNPEPVVSNPIGEAMAKEMNFPEASADISEINVADADNMTLEDLGLDELPY